jgi:hypothetical protein
MYKLQVREFIKSTTYNYRGARLIRIEQLELELELESFTSQGGAPC